METWIARGVMTLATANLPAERRGWGQAMRAELDSLDEGRLAWAFGCLFASLNWRLRKDWTFLAAAAAAFLFVDAAGLSVSVVAPWLHSEALFRLYFLAYPSVACLALSAWRPGYAFGVAVAMTAVRLGVAEASFTFLMRQPFPADFKVMNAPFIVGASAMLGWCWAGAAIGRRIATRRAAAAASSERGIP